MKTLQITNGTLTTESGETITINAGTLEYEERKDWPQVGDDMALMGSDEAIDTSSFTWAVLFGRSESGSWRG